MESSGAILPAPERAELDRLRSFMQSESPGAVGACEFSSWNTIADDGRYFSGSLRTRMRGLQLCHDPNPQISMSFRFGVTDAILHALQALVACHTLTTLSLQFPIPEHVHASKRPVFDTLVLREFSVLRTSRSLSALDISFSGSYPFRAKFQVPWEFYPTIFFPRHLVTLLGENPFLERVILDLGDLHLPEHAEAIARCFSGNSALRSCTLKLRLCSGYRYRHPLQIILHPFTTRVQSEANVGLKELVLESIDGDHFGGCGVCKEAIDNLVASNTTLEKLDVGSSIFPNRVNHLARKVTASAVGCNRTLKEIGIRVTIAEFKELVLVLVPDADGRQSNISLSTLKLSLAKGNSVLDCMADLAKLVGSNSTLKHVKVWQEWLILSRWSDFFNGFNEKIRLREKVVESRMGGELERMRNNELRRNASLQSLSVGWWKLLRVGDGHEWQMKYDGSCLAPRKEYVVEVKLR